MNGLILILVFGIIHSTFCAPPQSPTTNLKTDSTTPRSNILKQINKLNEDGSYTFGYEADDGSFKVETRSKDGVVKGKYGFIDASGQLKTVEYTTGRKSPFLANSEPGTSATETEPLTVKKNSREVSDSSSSSENNSNVSSGESSAEDDPAFNSFNAQPGQKDTGEPLELTKRQGQLGGGPGGSGIPIGSQYPSQGQRFQGSQPYVPTAQLQGGQFLDSRGQRAFGAVLQQQPIQFQGQGGQPPYFGGGPQQFQVGGFGRGGPQTHYVGRQYPAQYAGTPQFGGIQPTSGQFSSQPQINQIQSQDEEGFVSGPPGSYYNGGPQQQPQQFAYNGQNSQGFLRPGFQPGQYPGAGGQQFEGPQQFNRFGTSSIGLRSPQTFSRGSPNSQQEYTPNPEVDGFSEDNNQDGFVDPYPGNEVSKEDVDEKTPSVKSPSGERIPGQYTPQILGPQQGLPVQNRPGGVGAGISPYTEQELQQIYNQQSLGRQQTPYPQQFNRFALQGQQPNFQSFPVQQQYSPQIQFGGPQIIRNVGGAYIPGQGQVNGNVAYQGGSGFAQYPTQGQLPYIQGQIPVRTPQVFAQGRGEPQFVNLQQGGGPGAQLPYDYVGGIGPNGFPIGGPQAQFVQQQQQQQQQLSQGQGPSPGPTANLTPTSGSAQVGNTDSKKDN